MMIKRCLKVLTLMASCAALSYAQTPPPDGGVGGHAPARSQLVTSNNFQLDAVPCLGSPLPVDCQSFAPGVQEVFAFYNQSGTPFDSLTINLTFDTTNMPPGEEVGCLQSNIEPTWTIANCTNGVPINPQTGAVTLTFQQGTGGEGIGCYNNNPPTSDDPITSGNQNCLTNSFNNFWTDVGTGAQLPYVNWTQTPPPTQSSGACTYPPPPSAGIPVNQYFPWFVCGQDSWVLGIGLGQAGEFGYGPFTGTLPSMADVYANTPEPPTLLLVGAAMLAMSLFFMKKKVNA